MSRVWLGRGNLTPGVWDHRLRFIRFKIFHADRYGKECWRSATPNSDPHANTPLGDINFFNPLFFPNNNFASGRAHTMAVGKSSF